MSPSLTTAGQRAAFARDGVLVLRGFYDRARDVEPVQRGIHAIVGQVMKRHGRPDARAPFSPERFDEGYMALVRHDRAWGGEVYDAVKQIPAFQRLVADERHERLLRELRPGAIAGMAGGGQGIRIDHPGEQRFRAPWHQEYPAQLRSLDGVVYWSPLVPITEAIGPVRICPGSHREGPVPVHLHDPAHPEKRGAYALVLHDEQRRIARYAPIAPLTEPGDLVLMDFLVLHASGENVSERARWSMQFRYFNFDEPTGLRHGWKGAYAAGVDFRSVHPELCAD